MKLDLGCGKQPHEGHVGVDLPVDDLAIPMETHPLHATVDETGIIRFDLASGIPWPFADESIDGLFSSHTIEHLPASRIATYAWKPGALGQLVLHRSGTQDALLWFLDEAWRVTKPKGEFVLRWPSLRDARTGEIQVAAFQDPTHYRFIPDEQYLYWSREGRQFLDVEQYRARCNWVVDAARSGQRQLPGSLRVLETELLLVKEP